MSEHDKPPFHPFNAEIGAFGNVVNEAGRRIGLLVEQLEVSRRGNALLNERIAELEAELTRIRDITEDDANVECPACSVPLVVSPHRSLWVSEEDSNDEHVAFVRGHRSAYEAARDRIAAITAERDKFITANLAMHESWMKDARALKELHASIDSVLTMPSADEARLTHADIGRLTLAWFRACSAASWNDSAPAHETETFKTYEALKAACWKRLGEERKP